MKITNCFSLIFLTFSSVSGFIGIPSKKTSLLSFQNTRSSTKSLRFGNLIEGLDDDEEDFCDTEIIEDFKIPIRVMDKKIEDF